jgi:hypothetical protein
MMGDTPFFLHVWQGKDLQKALFVCVAGERGYRRISRMCGSDRT